MSPIVITLTAILHDPKKSHWSLKGLKGAPQLLGSMRDLVPLDKDKQAERGRDCPWGRGPFWPVTPLRGATLNSCAQARLAQCWADPGL